MRKKKEKVGIKWHIRGTLKVVVIFNSWRFEGDGVL